MVMSLSSEKAVILVGMFTATLCFGLAPVKLVTWSAQATNSQPASRRRRRRLKKAISLANCFSGGVFVAACLLDLFPDIHESIDRVLDEMEKVYHTRVDYPVAEFIIVFGFLLVLSVEQLVLEVQEKWSQPSVITNVASSSSPPANQQPQETDALLSNANYGSIQEAPPPPPPPDLLRQRYISGESRRSSHEGGGHDHSAMFEEHSALRSLVLLMALTFHSLFEGLAIGLQQDYGQLIQIFVAVIVHKGIMAFSLGLNLAQSAGMTVRYFVAATLIFSLASPLGMAIGIGLSDLRQSIPRDVANGVLQGIAGGTFLYITFFEVLPHEFSSGKMRMPKVFCVLLGYSAICGLLFITH